MRLAVIVAGIVGFALGVWLSPALLLFWPIGVAEGAALRCLPGNQVCVGSKASEALKPYVFEGKYGGLIGVACNFDEPGSRKGDDINLQSFAERGCPGGRYVATFSNGRVMTNFWVEDGVIVQLDRYPKQVLDL